MKTLLGFLLFLVAVALYVPLTVVNIPFVLWLHRKKRSFLKVLGGYFLDEATSIDIHGNRSLRALWNTTMRKPNGYKFGREGETISSVLGKNQRDKTLSFMGKLLAGLLDLLDKDHCKNAIREFNECPCLLHGGVGIGFDIVKRDGNLIKEIKLKEVSIIPKTKSSKDCDCGCGDKFEY